MTAGRAHWDAAYEQGEATRSWFQQQAVLSMEMLAAADVINDGSVLDVGGGASHLVDGLVERGYSDVTVLDISPGAVQVAQTRLGAAAAQVQWIVADLLEWQPRRRYDVWHDRALLHFMTTDAAVHRYLEVLEAATAPGAVAVLATFAPDGPDSCSGLPVRRYAARDLGDLLGDDWVMVTSRREEHTTPAGTVQPFTWVVARRG